MITFKAFVEGIEDKIKKVKAVFDRTDSPGEKQSAEAALKRMKGEIDTPATKYGWAHHSQSSGVAHLKHPDFPQGNIHVHPDESWTHQASDDYSPYRGKGADDLDRHLKVFHRKY